MGLIKQADDQMGRLFDWMEKTGRMDDTMIVLTSDHGDFLGDHWMGEKTFFHDASTKVPLIIYDPSPEADLTRGTTCDALVESIDLAPTFLEQAGGGKAGHILEGYSLLPILHGQSDKTPRTVAICEYDYSASPIAQRLNASVRDAVMFMVANEKWKLIHCEGGYRPILFDLKNDPDELIDLGDSADHSDVIAQMYDHLFAWARRTSQRTTRSEQQLVDVRTRSGGTGIMIGIYDGKRHAVGTDGQVSRPHGAAIQKLPKRLVLSRVFIEQNMRPFNRVVQGFVVFQREILGTRRLD